MRNALLIPLVFLIAACGAYHLPGAPSGTGAVTGTVVAVPCTPVESALKPCAGRPVPGVEVAFVNGGATANALTDSNGKFTVELASGTWLAHVKTYMRLISGPPQVNVADGSTVTANYVLDSGIRVPVPQQ
jgi:type 1 fimbria pilin